MQTKHQVLQGVAWDNLYHLAQKSQEAGQSKVSEKEWESLKTEFVEFYNALPPAPHNAAFLDELAGKWRRALKDPPTFYKTIYDYLKKPAFESHLADFAIITEPKRHYIPIFAPYAVQHAPPPASLDVQVNGANFLTDKEIGNQNKQRFLQLLNLNEEGIHKESHHQVRFVVKFVCENKACGAVEYVVPPLNPVLYAACACPAANDETRAIVFSLHVSYIASQEFGYDQQNRRGDEAADIFKLCTTCKTPMRAFKG